MLNLKALNNKQLEAVTYESGNLLVLAGPGSGKTFTIIQRINYLIEKVKVKPEKILVISFTKDSAKEMQERFLSGSNLIHPVVFGTFHSIFYYILRDCNYSNISILTLPQKKQIVINVLKKYVFPDKNTINNSELNTLTESVIDAISIYKNTLNYDYAMSRIDDKFSYIFQSFITEYEKERKAGNFIDFDDMVYDCFYLLERNKNAFNRWNGRFDYILIDEFQDINPIQYKVIRLLMNKNTHLFVVGDDDQSIYSFRGSEPDCMKLVIKECNCETINLQYNYRNPEQIRSTAENIIKDNTTRIDKTSQSMNPKTDKNHIFIHAYENKELHYEAIADKISEINNDVAVLFRTNLEMQRLAILLNKRGIKFICKERKQNIYEHFIVKDIMAYLLLANDINTDDNYELTARIINKPIRHINRESLIGDKSALENITEYYKSYDDKNFSKKITEYVNILKKDLSFINERPIYSAIVYVLKKIGYQQFLLDSVKNDKNKLHEYEQVINWLLDDCKGYETLTDYRDFQTNYSDNQKLENNKSVDNEKESLDQNGITLMTVHASKGLEFKNVIIAECNEGNFPHGRIDDNKIVEEERRLFYVAVTRSCENLFLYYIKGTKERIAVPSRFINCLLDKSNTMR